MDTASKSFRGDGDKEDRVISGACGVRSTQRTMCNSTVLHLLCKDNFYYILKLKRGKVTDKTFPLSVQNTEMNGRGKLLTHAMCIIYPIEY